MSDDKDDKKVVQLGARRMMKQWEMADAIYANLRPQFDAIRAHLKNDAEAFCYVMECIRQVGLFALMVGLSRRDVLDQLCGEYSGDKGGDDIAVFQSLIRERRMTKDLAETYQRLKAIHGEDEEAHKAAFIAYERENYPENFKDPE